MTRSVDLFGKNWCELSRINQTECDSSVRLFVRLLSLLLIQGRRSESKDIQSNSYVVPVVYFFRLCILRQRSFNFMRLSAGMSCNDILPDARKLTGGNYQTWKARWKLLLLYDGEHLEVRG